MNVILLALMIDKYRNVVSEHLLLNSTPGEPVHISVIDVNLVQDRIQQLKFCKAAGHDNVLNDISSMLDRI